VRLGTDYCDLTGEPSWCKYAIDKYDEDAKKKGVLIVPTCGFDSVPSDLGTQYILEYVKQTYKCECKSVSHVITKISGGVSGGTIASMVNEISGISSSSLSDAYSLNPPDKKPNKPQPGDFGFIAYNSVVKKWTIPFLMASINSRVVQRSQALQDFKYGTFRYSERMAVGNIFIALIMWLSLMVGMVAMFLPFVRPLLLWFLPKPGQGPKREGLKKGDNIMYFVAEPDSKGKSGVPLHVVVKVSVKGDIGYYVSARMMGEAGLALALDRQSLPHGGLFTPAAALGDIYRERLIKQGFAFEITQK